ncbi:MAG: hypothetical protein WCL06_09840 [Bacteroidota bacterium]
MKKIIPLLFLLLPVQALLAQQQSAPKDSVILRRFFHSIGRCCKNTNLRAKTVAYNAQQKYHDAPREANAFNKRFSISLNAGGNYYADFGKKHFPLDTGQFIEREINYSSTSIIYPNVSYTSIPGFSFHAGLGCAFQITKHFSVEGGLMYFSRRSRNIYSTDTNEINILNEFTKWDWPPYIYCKELIKNEQSIEIPFYFGYTYKRFSTLIGTRLILVMIDHTRNVRIDNSVQTSNEIRQPFGEGNQATDFTIPSVKLRYLINKEKIPISVYCSADWLNNKEWDLIAGVQVGIFSK